MGDRLSDNVMRPFHILISSAGRRIELMQCLRESISDNGMIGRVFAADCSLTSPACFLADRSFQVPRCEHPDFIPEMLEIARCENVSLIVPTIDSELALLAANRPLFEEHGICVSISALETVEISADKVATYDWLCATGFPTVRQALPEEILLDPEDWPLPLIAKPRQGSASKGVRRIHSLRELEFYAERESDLLVQEIAEGEEYTINIFVNRAGECVCAVPHRRLEVRAGEVSKAITVKNHALMELARRMGESLPGAYGMLNIQCFLTANGEIRVIEINARAGGGYPLTHHAGARFTHLLVDEAATGRTTAYFDHWTDDLAMLRYDQATFQPASMLRSWSQAQTSVSRTGSR
jgi:carbamoyl-phosphate synthase large subunit